MAKTKTIPDQDALRRIGETVRARLDADPKAYKVPTDKAEIWAIGEFLTPVECDRMMRMIDAVARPSSLYDQDYNSGFRTSYSGDLEPFDPLVMAVSRRNRRPDGDQRYLRRDPARAALCSRTGIQGAQRLVLYRSGLLEIGTQTRWPTQLDRNGIPQ